MSGNSRGSERCACEPAIIPAPTGYYTSPAVWPLAKANTTSTFRSRERLITSRPARRLMLSQSQTSVGYAVGAGGEVKLNRNWSVKGEYLFVDLGRRTIIARDIDGFPFMVSY